MGVCVCVFEIKLWFYFTGEPEGELASEQHDTDETPAAQDLMEEEEDVPLSRRSPSPLSQEDSEVGGARSRRQEEEEGSE